MAILGLHCSPLLQHVSFSSCPSMCLILVPQAGMKPVSPTVEGRFLTTRPPRNSQILQRTFFVAPGLNWDLMLLWGHQVSSEGCFVSLLCVSEKAVVFAFIDISKQTHIKLSVLTPLSISFQLTVFCPCHPQQFWCLKDIISAWPGFLMGTSPSFSIFYIFYFPVWVPSPQGVMLPRTPSLSLVVLALVFHPKWSQSFPWLDYKLETDKSPIKRWNP